MCATHSPQVSSPYTGDKHGSLELSLVFGLALSALLWGSLVCQCGIAQELGAIHSNSARPDTPVSLGWNARVIAELSCKERPHELLCSFDGRYCAALVWHGRCVQPLGPTSILVWEADKWTFKRGFTFDSRLTCVTFSSNGEKLIGGFGASSLTIHSAASGTVIWDVESGHDSIVTMDGVQVAAAQLSHDGQRIMIATPGARVLEVDEETKEICAVSKARVDKLVIDPIRQLICKDDDTLVGVGEFVHRWTARGLQPKGKDGFSTTELTCTALSSDGKWIASVDAAKELLEVRDIATGKRRLSRSTKGIIGGETNRSLLSFAIVTGDVLAAVADCDKYTAPVSLWKLGKSASEVHVSEELRKPAILGNQGKWCASWSDAGRIVVIKIRADE